MIPILYEEGESEFLSNGLGRLTDAISCVITQNNSGAYELVLEYPQDGIHAGEITNNRIIYAKPERGKANQPFRVRNIEKTIEGKMKVTARHNCYDLNYYACKAFGQTDVVPYQVTPSIYSLQLELIGILSDLIMYNVETGSTKWTLTMTYPEDGALAEYLNIMYCIYAQPAIGRDLVMFYIMEVEQPTEENPTYTVTAEAAIRPDVPREYNKMTVSQALGYVSSYTGDIQECPFTFVTDPDQPGDDWAMAQKEFWNEIPKAVRPLLQGSESSIADVFGGEWEFDHYNCILHESRGADNGVHYRYGKNIISISERINIDEIYTHAFSFWKGTASSSTDTEEGEYFTMMGTVISILDNEFSSMFPAQRTLIIDASSEFEEKPTVEQLDAYTLKYASDNSSGTPTVTIEVSIIDLANTKEYEDIAALETVNLYDTVTVVFPGFGVNVKAKVTEISFDVLKEKNEHVTIGDVTTKLSNIIAKNKADIVKAKYDLKKWADKAMERATEALAGWNGGNIRKNYNASDHKQQSMYIMNTDSVETAGKAIKFDGYGIGVSGDGVEGSYGYMINMAGGGISFSDEFAGDGNTNASFLKRGVIRGGSSHWDLGSGDAYFVLSGLVVDGDAYVSGTLNAAGWDVASWLNNLNSRVSALESSVSALESRPSS